MPENDDRRRLKKEYLRRERTEARSKMVLSRDELGDLVRAVDIAVRTHGCDHSLSQVRAWCREHALDEEVVCESVRHFGGFCDCEVVMNVSSEEIFRES